MLQLKLREAEVGVDDSPGAGGDVGDDDRVGTRVTGIFGTSLNLYPVLPHPLSQPVGLQTEGEGSQVPGPQSQVGEDCTAVVGITSPALKCQLRQPSDRRVPPCTGPDSSGRCPPQGTC